MRCLNISEQQGDFLKKKRKRRTIVKKEKNYTTQASVSRVTFR